MRRRRGTRLNRSLTRRDAVVGCPYMSWTLGRSNWSLCLRHCSNGRAALLRFRLRRRLERCASRLGTFVLLERECVLGGSMWHFYDRLRISYLMRGGRGLHFLCSLARGCRIDLQIGYTKTAGARKPSLGSLVGCHCHGSHCLIGSL